MGFIYHIIMISDMVPFRYKDFRRDASISLISTLMIVLSVFIFMIIQPGISLLIFKSSAKYKKYINRLQQRYDV